MLYENAFRLFVSSTFSDFAAEREALRTQVFPEIRRYCADQGGLSFQPIDLRWGVSEEAQLDQKTLDLCLNEVRTCKNYPAPNFIILAGDRYGWIPLPYAIEADEFELLRSAMPDDEQRELQQWYRKDENQIPVSYTLAERSGEFVTPAVWAKVENRLRRSLQTAALNRELPEEQRKKYVLSATEAEVLEGILEYGGAPTAHQQRLIDEGLLQPGVDPENVFAFIRNIRGALDGSIFVDGEGERAQGFKTAIRATVANLYETETELVTPDRVDTGYIERFVERVIAFLKQRVDHHVAMRSERTPLQIEIDGHADFRRSKLDNFQGRTASREIIHAYVTGSPHPAIEYPQTPLVAYGPSGRGKSSLMAKSIEEAAGIGDTTVVSRFTGATPGATSSREILLSIFQELGIDPYDTASEDTPEDESFEQFSERIRDLFLGFAQRPERLLVFIDAVDQLEHDDPFLWLPETLPENLKIVISALDDEHYPSDSRYYHHLSTRRLNRHEIPPFEHPLELMRAILASYHRRLQPHQEAYLLRQYASSESPFFIHLAAEELRHWKSTDGVADDETVRESHRIQDLSGTQQELVREFISNLKDFYHHNERFVTRVLGFIHASRDGLSEGELLQLIATDGDFIRDMAPDTWHQNTTGELPTVIWSRLSAQLKPFFRQSLVDGEVLISFFHREFAQAIAEHPRQQTEHRAAITACQQMISWRQYDPFNGNRWGKLYATLITEYELRYPEQSQLQSDAEFVAGLEDQWVAEFSEMVSSVGSEHHLYNRTRQAIAYQNTDRIVTKRRFDAEPERWAEDYTRALNNLASSYSCVDRTEEAITLGEESLEILKRLYGNNPERWAEDYTTALNNLASSYSSVDRTDEAITLEEECLEILKPLYGSNPERWAEDYTRALNNLASSYSSVDRTEEAIALEEESFEIRKRLYGANPERWAEAYTTALNNLASSYSSVDRAGEAIALEEESLEIRKRLYGSNPERWAEDYTTALNNLASSYSSVDRTEEAIALQEESLEIRKRLYGSNPERWTEKYTTALNNLAYLYSSVDRMEEAIALEGESLEIRKRLYGTNPERWAEDYTTALSNLAYLYSDVDRTEEAIALEEESLAIRKRLYGANLERWAEDYAIALNNLASSYSSVDREEEAIALQEESLEILKALYDNDPERWAADYTTALNYLAYFYKQVDQTEEAISLEEESLEILKGLYGRNPEMWAQDYTTALNNVAVSFRNNGQFDKAESHSEQAVAVYSQHFDTDETTATLYSSLGWTLKLAGKTKEAIDYLQKAVELRTEILGPDHKSTLLAKERLDSTLDSTDPGET